MELIVNVKTYDWGKLGGASEVAKLATLNCQSFIAYCHIPYAELWMGDHPNGPSNLKLTLEEFGDVLSANNELIGGHKRLPFLFKVLSIRKPLSIQVHPNKTQAEKLHAEQPNVYKDPNHKPELAIALTPFMALCGFRPYKEIYDMCKNLPPLIELLGIEDLEEILEGSDGLRAWYGRLMTASKTRTGDCIDKIAKHHSEVLQRCGLLELFTKVNNDFPGDVGVLSLFFLNLIRLKPGEAIYLPANEIHAYLEGDCIECMACSDNVIRAGLTPKFKDVSCLLEMLNYTGLPPEEKLFKPIQVDSCLQRFVPPVKDFAVEKLMIPGVKDEYRLDVQKYGAILLARRGERRLRFADGNEIILRAGVVVFIPGNVGERIVFLKTDKAVNFEGYIAKYNSF